ncbi:MAG: hypothetical protein Q9220_001620 [cf. Caloplaca sp. 1 TL-2023]
MPADQVMADWTEASEAKRKREPDAHLSPPTAHQSPPARPAPESPRPEDPKYGMLNVSSYNYETRRWTDTWSNGWTAEGPTTSTSDVTDRVDAPAMKKPRVMPSCQASSGNRSQDEQVRPQSSTSTDVDSSSTTATPTFGFPELKIQRDYLSEDECDDTDEE